MKTILIITGPESEYGTGHEMRMHALALELKRHKVTVQKVVLGELEETNLPLEYGAVILDRRDTAFPPSVLKTNAVRIALDNRGAGREQAHLAYDALPHPAMNDKEYLTALSAVLLPAHVTGMPCHSAEATVRLHNDKKSAYTMADFPRFSGRLSPRQFTQSMQQAERIACYFGQAMFEAIYLGKKVELYPVSEYHRELAQDFVLRLARQKDLLSALDGSGTGRLRQFIMRALKGDRPKL
jgi:hypothetical protein